MSGDLLILNILAPSYRPNEGIDIIVRSEI